MSQESLIMQKCLAVFFFFVILLSFHTESSNIQLPRFQVKWVVIFKITIFYKRGRSIPSYLSMNMPFADKRTSDNVRGCVWETIYLGFQLETCLSFLVPSCIPFIHSSLKKPDRCAHFCSGLTKMAIFLIPHWNHLTFLQRPAEHGFCCSYISCIRVIGACIPGWCVSTVIVSLA